MMEDILIDYKDKPELNKPIFIEGLPGVGNVGKLAVEHLMDEVGMELMAEISSIYFPPQVLVNEEGITHLVNNRLYYGKDIGEDNRDIIILTGDYQGMTPQGQYKLTDKMLSIAEGYGSETVISLGGYGQGEIVEEQRVLGAATNSKMVSEMKEYGVVFSKEHPSAGIVGASGLILGLGDKIYDMDGVCLMGETSGYFVDPGAARAVLEILIDYLKIEDIDFEALDDKAEEVEDLANKVMDLDMGTGTGVQQESDKDDLRYIG